MEGLVQDLRFSLRTFARRPGFAAAAVLTLTLGVGANAAVFSAVNALLLRSLPVADADRLVFGMALREGFDPFGTSLLEYALYRDEARLLASSGVGAARLFNVVEAGEPERLRGAAVTASYLRTLGVTPVLGRLFAEEEDRPGGSAVALVGHDLWQRRFGGDPALVGSTLAMEGRSYSIVGVMPAGFDLPYSAEVWVPLQAAVDSAPLEVRAANANQFVARLRPGVELEQADTELKGLAARLEREYPQIRRGWSFRVVPLRWLLLADIQGRTHRLLLALMAGVGVLLLICCANVANLLLARGVAREAEMAVRLSLGAGRGRLARQLLTESLLLAAAGGVLGVLLALWTQPLLRAFNPIQAEGLAVHLTDYRVDGRVLLFALAVTLLTAVAFGLLPALRASRAAPAAVLRREPRGSIGGKRWLGALVVGEIALATTLLAGGGVLVQSFARLQRSDLGFRPERLLALELPLSPLKYAEQAARVRFVEDLRERVAALPGVEAAGLTTNLPLQRGITLDAVFEAEGRPPVDPSEVPITAHRMVGPGYMEALGPTLLRGRFLDERDGPGAAPVVVVSEELARQAWPGQDPLGKRVRRVGAGRSGPWMTVVGLVEDVKEDRINLRIDRPVWYVPFAQQTFAGPLPLPLNLVVRASGEPAEVAAAVREAVRAVDPHQPVANVMPVLEYLSDVLIVERFGAALMATLAVLGTVLAAVGLYGVMAYSVSRRTGEIGLRMALGARPGHVLRLVLGQGGLLVLGGLLLGGVGAFGLTRLLASTLHEVSPSDPTTCAVVLLVLALVSLLACWLPARRATRLSPIVALRHE